MNQSVKKPRWSARSKAAILLMSLDAKLPGVSQQLFEKMGEAKSKGLLQEISSLGKIETYDINQVVEEFYSLAIKQDSLLGGKNLTNKLLKDSFGIENTEGYFRTKKGLFKFLDELTDIQLLDYLQSENRQVAALLLSLLPDERSAKILSRFPVDVAGELSRKMISIDIPNYELLWQFHNELEAKYLGDSKDKIEESQQIFKLSRVLEMMVVDTRESVMSMIAEQDKVSSKKLEQLIFSFHDMLYMSNKDLGIVLIEVEPLRTLAIAMQGVSAELDQKLKTCLSDRVLVRLEEEIMVVKDVSKKEVQAAQNDIVKLCRTLEKREIITSLGTISKIKQEKGSILSTDTALNYESKPLKPLLDLTSLESLNDTDFQKILTRVSSSQLVVLTELISDDLFQRFRTLVSHDVLVQIGSRQNKSSTAEYTMAKRQLTDVYYELLANKDISPIVEVESTVEDVKKDTIDHNDGVEGGKKIE